MKVLVQRVSKASVTVDGNILSSIDKGLLLFFCAERGDSEDMIPRYAKKIINLRIFEDGNGKMNLSVVDVKGELLSISQFTLAASLEKGNRPSFEGALEPGVAKGYYDRFCDDLERLGGCVKRGIFGAKMEVLLINDGPVTVML